MIRVVVIEHIVRMISSILTQRLRWTL
jgi:hypothetical protein